MQTGSWATLRPWQSRYSLSLASLICCGQLACYLPSLPAAQAQAALSVYCSMLCSHSYSYATHISVQAPLVTNCSHVIPQHANLGSSGLCPEIYPCKNTFKLPPPKHCLFEICPRDASLWKEMFLCLKERADYLILHYGSGLTACALLAGGRSLAVLVDGSCCSSFSDWSV